MVNLEVRLYAASASSVQEVESARGNRNQNEGACTFGPQYTRAREHARSAHSAPVHSVRKLSAQEGFRVGVMLS